MNRTAAYTIGLAIGLSLGTAMDNMASGVGIGIALGVAFDAAGRKGRSKPIPPGDLPMAHTTHTVLQDPDAGRFYIDLPDGEAYLNYRPQGDDTWNFTYVFVSPHLRGGTLAHDVTAGAFAKAKEEGKKVIPTCGYVRAWLGRNPGA
jgi:predicted GNAT family acetyltransferase